MRTTMVLMTISSLLLAGAVVAVEGGENKSATAATVKSRTFNVLNYGAVGDDKTDNTEAFSTCLKPVIAAAGNVTEQIRISVEKTNNKQNNPQE